jgi:flagellar hook-associated protein 1 FlgK
MALTSILDTAVSSLNANLTALRTISNNISNVNTPGYARQIVELTSQTVNGEGAGVEVSQVRRVVDLFLSAELRLTTARAESFDVQSDMHDRIQSLLGEPGEQNTLAGLLSEAFDSIAQLSTEPESTARRAAMIADVETLGDAISRLATQIQSLRVDLDRRLVDDVTTANTTLTRIHDLNKLIVAETLAGREAHGLADQRDQAINSLSEIMDVRVTELSNGAVSLSTASGLALLDSSPRKLVYAAPGTVGTTTRFPEITVNAVDPVTKVVSPSGIPLFPAMSGGRLHGYIEMRDVQLPDFAVQLGEFASQFVGRLNAAHNDNTAVPPPNSLSGHNTGLVGTDPHGFTGDVRLAVIDSSNAIKSSFVVDFASYTTVNDVINAVNTALAGDATLTLANGALTFSAVSGTEGVAMLQDATTPSDRAGRGFAHFFGLNDLVEAKVETNPNTGFTGTDSHGFTGTVNLELRGAGGQVAATHTVDFGAIGADFNAWTPTAS